MLVLLFLLISCGTEVGIIGYTEKPPGDTATLDDTDTQLEPSSEPDDSPTERMGITGYTYLHLRQVACPACVGESQEIRINFAAEFHQPISDNHTEWLPNVGECTNSLTGINPSTIPIDVGSSLSVTNQSHSFSAPAVGTGYFQTENVYEGQLQRDAPYEVQTDEGSYTFISSHGFDFIEPYTMLFVDPSYAFAAPINRSGASFSWGPPSVNSIFMIRVAAYTSDGSFLLGHATCVGEANGFMPIPSQYIGIFPSGALAAIYLSRHKIELVETDINNSYIETHMEWEVVGTGYICIL